MKFVLAIVALLAVATAVSAERTEDEYRTAFTQFMQNYNKTYPDQAEFSHRYTIFKTNLDFIDSFSHPSFSVGINEFADMSNQEFVGIMNGYRVNHNRVRDEVQFAQNANPASVDWRTKGVVTKVKNQGQCGSCWSFSTTGSTEGAHALKTGKLVSLSEQNLMDCSWKFGNLGCNGGEMTSAFRYIISNKGVDTEVSYPYTAHDGTCRFSSKNVGATLSSFKEIPRGSESSLETASATVGPISVAIDASHMSFQFYKSGVYYEPRCSSTSLDHGVLVVGYGVDSTSSEKYWIVKNSWGATWGQAGYIWMSKDRSNNCGIATEASYPIV